MVRQANKKNTYGNSIYHLSHFFRFNDEIINTYLEILARVCNAKEHNKLFMFSTYFYEKIKDGHYEQATIFTHKKACTTHST
jgi:hypothetical protein